MPFTFTPVVAGNPIDAQPLQDVFDNLQAYINGGVAAGDLANNTLQKHHIMKGTYQPLPNTFNFVSGICGGQSFTSAEEKLSFMAGTTTQPINGNVTRKYYPTTSMTFYVEKECTAFFQFFACPLMFNFALSTTTTNEREGSINVYVDNETIYDTKCWTHEEWYATQPTQRLRELFSGHYMKKLSVGWHTIGLEGYTNGQDIFLINWGFTLETWHDNRSIANGEGGQG